MAHRRASFVDNAFAVNNPPAPVPAPHFADGNGSPPVGRDNAEHILPAAVPAQHFADGNGSPPVDNILPANVLAPRVAPAEARLALGEIGA